MTRILTQEQASEPLDTEGMTRADLLDYLNIDYIIEEGEKDNEL